MSSLGNTYIEFSLKHYIVFLFNSLHKFITEYLNTYIFVSFNLLFNIYIYIHTYIYIHVYIYIISILYIHVVGHYNLLPMPL